jgi:peptidoglycan/xylan/chitin deacetylase (PgdA/CDA1 family)
VWRRVVAEGHLIGNQSYTHPIRAGHNLATMSEAEIEYELVHTQQILNRVLGFEYPMWLMRPPGGIGGYQGKVSPRLMTVVRRLGLHLVMWSIDSNGVSSSAAMLTRLERPDTLQNGSIVLTHFPTLSPADTISFLEWLPTSRFVAVNIDGLFT